MKLFLILSLLYFNLYSDNNIKKSQEPESLLKSIAKHAIKIGKGTSKIVYIFVDPMCKYSKKIITNVSDNKLLLKDSTYYILLYGLKKYDSDKLMAYILESDDKLSTLEEIMVYDSSDIEEFIPKVETLNALKEIAEVGEKLKMKLRPYIISFEKDSKYCMVSEGEASCIEGF